MDTDSFIDYIKTEDIYINIAKDFETKFDILNYEIDKQLPTGKNKTVIGLMKDESEFVGLRQKIHSYRAHDNDKE